MPNRYIVVFKEQVKQDKVDEFVKHVDEHGGKVTHKYGTVLNGFAAELPDELLNSLQSFAGGDIDYIDPDGVVTTQ